jgi:hypothetical protein
MKVVDPDDLIVSTTFGNLGVDGNIFLNTTTKEFFLAAYGSLVLKDGVTGNAIWAKFVDLWTTAPYQPFSFPMNILDARSGQYIFGQDPGGSYNGWKPGNDQTRQAIRDAGWSEYNSGAALTRQYVGVVALASGFPAGAQFYFQRAAGGAAINFTFTDAPNEAIQVFGDATNGNFDSRTYFKMFCREYNYTYDDAVLGDVGESGTGPYKIALPISVGAETGKVTANDGIVSSNAPYTGITITYYGSDQNRTIGGGSYPFRKIINGNSATLEQIYTKMQYLLRQNSDIDAGAGTVTGKTEGQLCYFVGDTLYTTQGVFIENIQANDTNRVVFLDQNNVQRSYPFVAAGTLNFNSFLTAGGTGYYKMYFTTLPGAGNDYTEAGAVVVDDNAAADIAGVISSASIGFTFDYDNNNQGTRTPGTDAAVTIIAGNAGSAKPVVATGTITRSKGISFTLTAEQDRGYIA